MSFENVSFGYNNDKSILNSVSFTISGGSKVAIVGTSGAGKSTILRLLYRFYDPTSGSVKIDETKFKRCFTGECKERNWCYSPSKTKFVLHFLILPPFGRTLFSSMKPFSTTLPMVNQEQLLRKLRVQQKKLTFMKQLFQCQTVFEIFFFFWILFTFLRI